MLARGTRLVLLGTVNSCLGPIFRVRVTSLFGGGLRNRGNPVIGGWARITCFGLHCRERILFLLWRFRHRIFSAGSGRTLKPPLLPALSPSRWFVDSKNAPEPDGGFRLGSLAPLFDGEVSSRRFAPPPAGSETEAFALSAATSTSPEDSPSQES